jgi:hypothetical protein
MRLPLCCLVLIFLIPSLSAKAQNRIKFIGIESGANFIQCKPVNKSYIRGDNSTVYYGDGISQSIKSEMYKIHLGATIEVKSLNDKFGFITGLRFTQLNTSISKNTSPDYFFFLYQQTGTTTEYLRVRKIQQTATYTGIPIEVRFFPFPRLKKFRIYFMAGTEIGYEISSRTKVDFYDRIMESYKSGVLKIIGDHDHLYSVFYGGAGFRIGKEGKPGINLGVTAPVIFTNQNSSLVTPIAGGGVNIHFQIPF